VKKIFLPAQSYPMLQLKASMESLKIIPARLVLMKIPEGYTFELIGPGGERWVAGSRFESAIACVRAMMSLKQNADDKKCFRKCISGDRQHYFIVTNPQGVVIASSDLFKTAAGRDNALLYLQRELVFAEMVEQ
jgi:hypothetical protein